jgi:hypothetical protein
MPVTTPDDGAPAEPTTAATGEPLLHVPPVVISLSVVVLPIHIVSVPVIASGAVFTVTG